MRQDSKHPRLEVEFRWLPCGTEKQDGSPYLVANVDVDAALIAINPNAIEFVGHETSFILRALIEAAGATWPESSRVQSIYPKGSDAGLKP
jgi:hypothetical protein